MHDRALHQRFLDLLLDRLQLVRTALDQALDRADAHRLPEQVVQHFTGTGIGHQLLLHQVDCQCAKGRAILHRGTHVLRKARLRDLLTTRAPFAFGLMFDYHHAFGWQIDHLPTLLRQAGLSAQVLLALPTPAHLMHDHLVGLLAEQQRAPIMSLLPSGLLAAFLPQALCIQ